MGVIKALRAADFAGWLPLWCAKISTILVAWMTQGKEAKTVDEELKSMGLIDDIPSYPTLSRDEITDDMIQEIQMKHAKGWETWLRQ